MDKQGNAAHATVEIGWTENGDGRTQDVLINQIASFISELDEHDCQSISINGMERDDYINQVKGDPK